jgi:hypothetical protein
MGNSAEIEEREGKGVFGWPHKQHCSLLAWPFCCHHPLPLPKTAAKAGASKLAVKIETNYCRQRGTAMESRGSSQKQALLWQLERGINGEWDG